MSLSSTRLALAGVGGFFHFTASLGQLLNCASLGESLALTQDTEPIMIYINIGCATMYAIM